MAFQAKFLGIPRDMPFLINTKNEYIVHTTQWRGISNNNPNVPASSLSRASCYVGTLLRNTSGGVPRIQRAFRPKSRSRLPLFFGGGGWLSAQLFAFEKDGKLRPERKKKRTSGVLMHLITPSRLLLLDSVRWRRRRKPHSPLKMEKGEEESPFLPNRLSKNK